MCQLAKKIKIINLLLGILICILMICDFSSFARFIDIKNLTDNKSGNIIYAGFEDMNIKVLLNSDGEELVVTKGKYDDVGILYDIIDNSERYLYSMQRSYKSQKYYFSGYHFDIYTKVDIYTNEGEYVDTLVDEVSNKKFSPIFCYKDNIFYMSVGYDVNEEDIERLIQGYTAKDQDYYKCKLFVYNMKTMDNKCVYIDSGNYSSPASGYMDLKYVLKDGSLYIVITNIRDRESDSEERKNVHIVSFIDSNNIKTLNYEYVGENAKKAYINWDEDSKIIEDFIIDEKESESKKVFVKDFDTRNDIRLEKKEKYTTIEKDNVCYMVDEEGKIFAKGFDVNDNYNYISIGNNGYLLVNNAVYGKDGLVINLNKKRLYGSVNKYLVVSNAFNYGLIDLNGNWFYKKSMFDTIEYDE